MMSEGSKGTRPERVAEEIRKIVSRLLQEKVSDPRIGFISITSVDLSPDLKNAKIFASVLGSEDERKKTFEGLKSATPFIRVELGRALRELRSVPEIAFVYDKSIERGTRVLAILHKLEREAAEGRKYSKKQKSNKR
ncbi:MAG: 30S ribosome-binding factor RbfA [Candidatus Margulisiibacteriota bacterium]